MFSAVELEGRVVGFSNDDLQRFFDAKVAPDKDETKRIIAILKPEIEKLFAFIKKHDARLCQQVAHVGSFYQKLKVRRSDEFDYTLCLDISREVVSSEFSVNTTHCRVRTGHDKLYYGFKGKDSDTSDMERLAHTSPQDRGDGIPTKLHNTMEETLEIVSKSRPLVRPGEGYFVISLGQTILMKFEDMSFSGDLVPRLVRLKLKEALKKALELEHYFEGKFTCGFTAHGPALMLKYKHEKIPFPISIDIAPGISTNLSFDDLGMQWPRQDWPSQKLCRAVKQKGVMLVAKQNFYWMISFVECEKELAKRADEDGGIRKIVHRLMKICHTQFWKKTGNQELNSYLLKVRSKRIEFQTLVIDSDCQ